MYAVPSPSFPSRWITLNRGSFWRSASASCPVPSGELSSTMRMSSRGSWARMCGTRWARFAASLYVGMTTNPRSGISSPPPPQRHGQQGERREERQRHERDRLAGLVLGRAEAERGGGDRSEEHTSELQSRG